MSPILHKRRARAWLDENIGDHWGRSVIDGHYFAMVPGEREAVTADTLEELADKCEEILFNETEITNKEICTAQPAAPESRPNDSQ